MPASLFIEHHANGLAFYINGDLQFDTADEAIYHEYLVVPAIALAIQRFPNTQLRVLICGGGDGLAARDALSFSEVGEVTLVDYDSSVLELGRTVFKPFNRGSLAEEQKPALGASRVAVHTQDAFEFASHLPNSCYHVVIADFTFPTCAEDTRIYSREWFQEVQRVLHPGGVMSTNGVSPEQRSLGFWCLYQTLLAAELHAKPLQVAIPSFQRHGYGDWGFFLASSVPIERSEVETVTLPSRLRALQSESWFQAFKVREAIASHRHTVNIHTLECPQLFYYLLNPQLLSETFELATASDSEVLVDFLDFQESGTGLIGTLDPLTLDSMVKVWLNHLNQSKGSDLAFNVEQLMPVQHRYHSPKMTQEWVEHLKSLLGEIDANQLLSSLLERAQELPPQLARELKQLQRKIRLGQPLAYVSNHTGELITILSVTLLMANLTAPDAVFAKGFWGGSSRSYGGSSGGYYDDGDGSFGWFGFWMTMVGGMWLWSLYRHRDGE
jgi:spermidine synthase